MSQADLILKKTTAAQATDAEACQCSHAPAADKSDAPAADKSDMPATDKSDTPVTDKGNAPAASKGAVSTANKSNTAAAVPSCLDQVQALVQSWQSRPSWDEYFMATALLIASRSSCERLHVGCVLVSAGQNPNRIIAAGYNGFLSGHPHLSRVRDNHEQGTVHAEQNALADAARRGISVQGATAYVTHFPCIICTRLLLASGIAAVKYRFDYNNDPLALELWKEAAIPVTQLQ